MAEKKGKSRPRVALLLSQMVGLYCEALWPSVVDAAEQRDVDLLILPGENLRYPYYYEYQNNILYELLTARNCDALIIAAGTLCNHISVGEYEKYFRRFQKFKTVTLGMKMPGFPAVLVDNRSGVLETVKHLVSVHGYRRIAYISGSESNAEARDRRDAFLEGLKNNGLKYSPDLMYQGDFSNLIGSQAMQHFLKTQGSNLEAVVCGNDQTAIGVLEVLEEKRISVPRDIAVVGFDNIDEVRFHPYSPLTTVAQPIREQAFLALDMVLDLLDGKKVPESVVLPTKLVVRSSCGCLSQSIDLPEESGRQSPTNPKTQTRKNGKSLEVLITDEKDRTKALEWCDRILTRFQKEDWNEEDPNSLLIEIGQVMAGDIRSERDVSLWQTVITLASLRMDAQDIGSRLPLFHAFLQEARILVGEKMQLQQARLRLRDRLRIETLMMRAIQNLIATLTVDDLLDAIAKELPALAIPSFYISLYPKPFLRDRTEDNWTIPQDIDLALACNASGRIPLGPETVRYQTLNILPLEHLASEHRRTLIVKPLFFREEQFGIIIQELGWRLGLIYGTLQFQISTALKVAERTGRKSPSQSGNREKTKSAKTGKTANRKNTGSPPSAAGGRKKKGR